MEHRLGSMNIMSSKHLLVHIVVIACGDMEEGPSANELRLGILSIASRSVETLDHTNAEIPKR